MTTKTTPRGHDDPGGLTAAGVGSPRPVDNRHVAILHIFSVAQQATNVRSIGEVTAQQRIREPEERIAPHGQAAVEDVPDS
ncbi:hypothetical protein [Streptomyces sp. x-80]|uniref:hypothetical protein n=1 Tax=Streptomyces sp. x-80 TaxID=2789282 RepID=UPI003980958B